MDEYRDDVVGIIVFDYPRISREEFFKNATALVASIAKSKSEKTQEYFKNTKAYIMGEWKGNPYYQVWLVKADSKLYHELEKIEGKVDYQINGK